MKFSIEFTTGARQDLLKIQHYIKSSGKPATAAQLVADITEVCKTLREDPERGHVPEELQSLSNFLCRQIIFKNYRITYQIIGKIVLIYGVIDGRRSLREVMRQRQLL